MLDALQPRTLVEVGSDAGGNTRNLLEFCERSGATLHVIDPLPKYEVEEMRQRYGDRLVFHEDLSLNALPQIEGPDAVLIDGDHNWYTVINELKQVEKQCQKLSHPFPLVMLHDVGWPYGRRDLYYDPDTIPEEHRKPHEKKGLHPDSEELLEDKGLNQHLDNATEEGAPESGVLTAVEDFVAETNERLELVEVPGLHGLGILFSRSLREENAEFAAVLETLSMPETAARLVESVERERLEALISYQELRHRMRRLKARREAEASKLREQLGETRRSASVAQRELTEARQALSRREQRVSALERQLEQRDRDVDRLYRWLKQMNNGVSELLASKPWKAGEKLKRLHNRVLRRPTELTMTENLVRVRQRFRAWRTEYESARAPVSQEPRQRPHSGSTNVAPSSAESVRERGSLGIPEHILESLRGTGPITVLVPIYNALEDLKRCLEALGRNTTAPAELLLIDDASPDPRIAELLQEYEPLENVRVLTNEKNLGFVETVNRGFSESAGDVVLLNSDAEVTSRWLENLTLAAHADPRTATVTAISDNAGAFSMPDIGKKNATPDTLTKDAVGRLVTQHSGQLYPHSPTGNGFCMYVKRAALDDVGLLDAESFPRGYGEENDFCLRAVKRGWNNVVDDATFVFHERTASFGETKQEIYAKARAKLDELHPEYTQLARAFVGSEDMKLVGENVRTAYAGVEPGQTKVRPRALYVLHHATGGTPQTNRDLMEALTDRYEPYLLTSNARDLKLYRLKGDGLELIEERPLRSPQQPTEFTRPDYRAIVFDLLTHYRFELVHIRHLLGHTFDLPEVAATLGIPVVLSFHDFYFSCPTVHLIDDNDKHCGGVCTPGKGVQCRIGAPRLQNLPVLKHAWVHTWRDHVREMFENVDAFVTTSEAAKEVYLRSLPVLDERRFEIIEHGRDLEQDHCALPPGDGPIKLLIPGNINVHKGAEFIRSIKEVDKEDRIELHLLGNVASSYRDLGIFHGVYEREEFNDRVREIAPSFMGIFSIWPETYCHTLTEAWAAGVPVLASDIGVLRERVNEHGGGWLLDYEDPEGSYRRILEISADREEYERELEKADLRGIRSTREMAEDYASLYESLVRERQRFRPPNEVSTA